MYRDPSCIVCKVKSKEPWQGNPFLDASPELIVLDSRNCAGDAVVATIRSSENLGKSQYQEYVDNVIKEQKVTI